MSAKEYYKSTRAAEQKSWTSEMVFSFAEEYANSLNKKEEEEQTRTTCSCDVKHRDLKEIQTRKCIDCGGVFKL